MLHVLTHSFPTRRSSDLRNNNLQSKAKTYLIYRHNILDRAAIYAIDLAAQQNFPPGRYDSAAWSNHRHAGDAAQCDPQHRRQRAASREERAEPAHTRPRGTLGSLAD